MAAEVLNQATTVSTFEEIIRSENISYKIGEYDILTDSINEQSNWVLHVSLIGIHIAPALKQLVKLFKENKVGFRVPKNSQAARVILTGKFGEAHLAKVITVYPNDDQQTVVLADQIKIITKNYNGPNIPRAADLGGNVYAQYTGKEQYHINMWPFPIPIPKPKEEFKKILFGKYILLNSLKTDFKGDVFLAKYRKGLFSIRTCVIKSGRQHMWSDEQGRDIGDRLRWQRQLQDELKGIVRVPHSIDLLTHEGDTYLAMEFIKGKSFSKILDEVYLKRSWTELTLTEKNKVLQSLFEIILIAGKLHEHGYVHRDLKPDNFMLEDSGRIALIDLELAYNLNTKEPKVPFAKGTPGFISPQQARQHTPTIKEDVYAIGGLIVCFIGRRNPANFTFGDPEKLAIEIKETMPTQSLADLVMKCYSVESESRPSLESILNQLIQFKEFT